jgi:hypothetical protein
MRRDDRPDAALWRASVRVPTQQARLCLFDRRHRHSGNPEVHGAEEIPIGETECLPVRTSEGEVCGLWLAVDDAPKFLALGVEDPEAARAAAKDVPRSVDLHAVRYAGLGAAKLCEHAIGLPRQRCRSAPCRRRGCGRRLSFLSRATAPRRHVAQVQLWAAAILAEAELSADGVSVFDGSTAAIRQRTRCCTHSTCWSSTARISARCRWPSARRARLLGRKPLGIVSNEHTDADGATVFRHACKLGLEGIV